MQKKHINLINFRRNDLVIIQNIINNNQLPGKLIGIFDEQFIEMGLATGRETSGIFVVGTYDVGLGNSLGGTGGAFVVLVLEEVVVVEVIFVNTLHINGESLLLE